MMFKVRDDKKGTHLVNPITITWDKDALYLNPGQNFYDREVYGLSYEFFERAVNDAVSRGEGILDLTPEGVAGINEKFSRPVLKAPRLGPSCEP